MIDFSGPFFQVDVEKTLFDNVQKMMLGIAEEGSTAARAGFEEGASSRALVRMTDDRVADHVVGRIHSRAGKEWHTAAVVQVYNQGLTAQEGISLMAAAAYVERRTHAIRNVTRQLRSARAALTANLTAGLE